MDDQPPAPKLPAGLFHEVQAIHDKVKLRDDTFALEIGGQGMDAKISQSGLAASLGVPDDALADARLDFCLDRFGGEELRIAHHMFFPSLRGGMHIGEPETQEEGEAFSGKQGGENAVGGGERVFVCGKLRCVLDGGEIGIEKNEVFGGCVLGSEDGGEVEGCGLTEVMEYGFGVRGGGVESGGTWGSRNGR